MTGGVEWKAWIDPDGTPRAEWEGLPEHPSETNIRGFTVRAQRGGPRFRSTSHRGSLNLDSRGHLWGPPGDHQYPALKILLATGDQIGECKNEVEGASDKFGVPPFEFQMGEAVFDFTTLNGKPSVVVRIPITHVSNTFPNCRVNITEGGFPLHVEFAPREITQTSYVGGEYFRITNRTFKVSIKQLSRLIRVITKAGEQWNDGQ